MKHRLAFTMLELIFVIVIMGIIGKFGVEFVAQVYKSFIFASVNHNLQSNSEHAVEFIAKRLEYRIKDSVIARTGTVAAPGPVVAIGSATGNYTILEWIGIDADGFRGSSINIPFLPNWSSLIDLDDSNSTTLQSPDTNTTLSDNLIKILSDNNTSIADAAIFFIGANSDVQTGYGWNGALVTQTGSMHPITTVAGDSEKFTSSIAGQTFTGVDLYEYYQLAWSAYAIVMQDYNQSANAGKNMGRLVFYYDYQPWKGDTLANAKSVTLMENVSTFQFTSIGSIMKIQVCAKSDLVEEYSLCKEKTVF
ncbi:type II secretion system protein [Sulfurimonas sp.]